jgi:hypothetical protein
MVSHYSMPINTMLTHNTPLNLNQGGIMTIKFRQIILLALLFISLIKCIAFAESRSLNMAVIAPSVSTSMEARTIMRQKGWIETNFRQADGTLYIIYITNQ